MRPTTNTSGVYNDGRNAQNHKDYVRKRRNKRKEMFVEELGGKCSDCGNKFPLCCYDFHHLDESTKSFEIAPGLDRAIDVLTEEVDKCVMLCSNCHRIRHAIDSPILGAIS